MAVRKTPATSNQKQQAFGNIPMGAPAPPQWRTAVVHDYDPNTQNYTLSIDGVGHNDTAPRLARDPGDLTVLSPETVVVVHNALGYWVVDAVLKQAPVTPSALSPATITEVRGIGGEHPSRNAQNTVPSSRPASDPVDTLPGDWTRRSPDNNYIGVLAGGVNMMHSSPFAQIRTHALEDLVEVFAHKFRHISAMGNMEIKTDNGKTSLIWRAGSDQGEENGAGRENWTIRLDVGAIGDLFNLSVTRPDGQLLSRIHLDGQGKVQIIGVDGVDIISGGSPTTKGKEIIASGKETQIKGDRAVTVGGSDLLEVGSSRDTSISGNETVMLGNDKNEVVSRDYNGTINGHWNQKVMGGLLPIPGVPAYELELLNGGVTFVLSDVAAGANPLGQASFNVINNFGGVNFVCAPTALGGFNVVTTLPASVNLGATGTAVKLPNGAWVTTAIAPFGVMMFEPFMAMIQALLTLIDTHVHITAVGPTTPPIIPSTPIVSPLLPLIRSLRVAVGA